jgi:hypothetical protein
VSFMTFLPSIALLFSLSPLLLTAVPLAINQYKLLRLLPIFSKCLVHYICCIFIISFRSIWPEGNQNLALAICSTRPPFLFRWSPFPDPYSFPTWCFPSICQKNLH